MKKLLIILYFTLVVSKLNLESLTLANNLANDSELKDNIDFTICIDLLKSEKYQDILAKILSDLPDDYDNDEIGLALCQKLSETEEFQNLSKPLYAHKNQLKLYNKKSLIVIPNHKQIEPLAPLDKEIVLQGFWGKLWNRFVDFLEDVVTLIADKIKERLEKLKVQE